MSNYDMYSQGGGGGDFSNVMMFQQQAAASLGLPVVATQALMSAQQQQQEKINRELFVGNTPAGTSELLLLHFVNAAMRRVGLCQPTETPVLNCRVNSKFAFIELVHAEMANRALNLNGIPFLGAVLKVSRPSKYTGPTVPARTWQDITGLSLPAGVALDAEQEKMNRELFIGNTTPEMTESMLREFLGNAMLQVGLNDPNLPVTNPITACRVSGKFAFVELRSHQEAANALNLNNIPYLGTALRVGRPSKWNGPPDHHGNWEDILAKYMSGELQPPSNNNMMMNSNMSASTPANYGYPHSPNAAPAAATVNPTRIVEVKHMLCEDDLANEDEHQEIVDDTREECSKFGNLLSVIIPKAGQPGATKIFLEYASPQDAAVAIQALQGRTFDGRRGEASYFDETKFANQQYD